MDDEIAALSHKAEQGDADVQLRLGSLYFSGKGVERDPGKAEKWWRRAAARGALRQRSAWSRSGLRTLKAIMIMKRPTELTGTLPFSSSLPSLLQYRFI